MFYCTIYLDKIHKNYNRFLFWCALVVDNWLWRLISHGREPPVMKFTPLLIINLLNSNVKSCIFRLKKLKNLKLQMLNHEQSYVQVSLKCHNISSNLSIRLSCGRHKNQWTHGEWSTNEKSKKSPCLREWPLSAKSEHDSFLKEVLILNTKFVKAG